MNPELIQRLDGAVRDVPDFPKEGILFKDITPVLADPELFSLALDALEETTGGIHVDKVVGIDARGFIFGAPLAQRLGAGFVPVRKKGKLPYTTHARSFALEYGEAEIEIHTDAVAPGERAWLVDDLLATGGTAAAACELLHEVGAELVAASFFIELDFLNGRDVFGHHAPVRSVLSY